MNEGASLIPFTTTTASNFHAHFLIPARDRPRERCRRAISWLNAFSRPTLIEQLRLETVCRQRAKKAGEPPLKCLAQQWKPNSRQLGKATTTTATKSIRKKGRSSARSATTTATKPVTAAADDESRRRCGECSPGRQTRFVGFRWLDTGSSPYQELFLQATEQVIRPIQPPWTPPRLTSGAA